PEPPYAAAMESLPRSAGSVAPLSMQDKRMSRILTRRRVREQCDYRGAAAAIIACGWRKGWGMIGMLRWNSPNPNFRPIIAGGNGGNDIGTLRNSFPSSQSNSKNCLLVTLIRS
ncbi:MAG TPA: hypothetical protein VF780_07200, partial [Nitrosospira sp.]